MPLGYDRLMNPARRLHDTFSMWRDAYTNQQTSAGITRALDTSEGMEQQVWAMEDLSALVRGLDDLERRGVPVRVYRRYVKSWTQMVIAYPQGWTNGQSGDQAFPSSSLDQLDTLADWFEDRRPSMTRAGEEKLGTSLSDAQALLDEDDTLSDMLRLYIGDLLREIRAALDSETLGGRFDFEDAARRLWVALFAASAQSTHSDARSKWSNLAQNFFWPAAASMIGSAPQTILAITSATGHS